MNASRIEEELQLKIAITSKGKELDSPMDPRFGRAAYILIVDTLNHGLEVLDNSEKEKYCLLMALMLKHLGKENETLVARTTAGFTAP